MADQTDHLAELERLHEAAGEPIVAVFDESRVVDFITITVGGVPVDELPEGEQDALGRFAIALLNNGGHLLQRARLATTLTALLAELTALLCTEPGQDVVERAKALVALEERTQPDPADPSATESADLADKLYGDRLAGKCGAQLTGGEIAQIQGGTLGGPERPDQDIALFDAGRAARWHEVNNWKAAYGDALKQVDSLRVALAAKDQELRKSRAFAMADTPWDIRSVLEKLTEAADILLKHHNWTGDGWELIHHARDAAQRALASDYADEDTAPALRKRLVAKDQRLARMRAQYHELILEVGTVHKGETRHETARRYIRERELPQGGIAAAPEKP